LLGFACLPQGHIVAALGKGCKAIEGILADFLTELGKLCLLLLLFLST
jgi:hypothetical protein